MILALETSTPRGSLALLDPASGALAGEEVFPGGHAPSATLFAPLRALLDRAPAPVTCLVVGTGPGSYGGVRAAISAALGLSLAWEIPAFGLPSIVSLAPDALVAGDARRACFFTAEVRNHRLVSPPAVHDEAGFRATLASTSLPILTMDPVPPLGLESISLASPDAACLARLAARLDPAEWAERAASPLQPLYVRPPYITQPRPRRPAGG